MQTTIAHIGHNPHIHLPEFIGLVVVAALVVFIADRIKKGSK